MLDREDVAAVLGDHCAMLKAWAKVAAGDFESIGFGNAVDPGRWIRDHIGRPLRDASLPAAMAGTAPPSEDDDRSAARRRRGDRSR